MFILARDYLMVTGSICLQASEALRRAKFKFPGRQKIVESRNWGFTAFNREDYIQWKQEGRMLNCGVHARVRKRSGPCSVAASYAVH
jgi:hypothetical protein